MVRLNDPFWDHVEKLDDGTFQCTFCDYIFAAATSISRIKWHLSGVTGRGVKTCKKVAKDIQDAAREAIDGPPAKKHKAIAGSRNYHGANTISTSAQEQNYEGRHVDMPQQGEPFFLGEHAWANDLIGEGIELVHDALETRAITEQASQEIELTWERSSPEELPHGAFETMPRAEQLQHLERGSSHDGRLVQPGAGASSSGVGKYNTSEARGDPLPTSSTKLVGRAFEENTNVIRTWLMDDKVSTIGIYGMGGVGKTRMLQHIHNELLQRQDISHRVYWVTVSRDFSIKRLQNLIAKCLKLDLSSEDDDLHRAVKLSKELTKKQEWILILDDLWDHFELHKVGIPIPLKGCKLIMTTRSKIVCQRMDSRHKINVNPLSKREAWALFMEIFGRDTALSPEVEQIAKSVARECAGLPLGIITMARTMRGVDDINEWKNALEDLRQSRVRQEDMEDEVFRILRFSYTHLKDLALQQCFLYCALFREDFEISKEDLIEYLIDEGVIKGFSSREAKFVKGHSMLNRLENVCLLERIEGGSTFKMHDLIRDMAIQIQQENSQCMVKAGAHLKELPDTEEWTEHLVRVSLTHNQIERIPSSHSPRCLNLSTLWLCYNHRLSFIADSFFKQLPGLKVLDLSETAIEHLPDSVSDLVSLTTLLLKDCLNLRHVPSLEKLTELKRLDLLGTRLENMPAGMECLTSLRYLQMDGWGKKEGCGEEVFPCGILPKLTNLEVLVLCSSSYIRALRVKVKEVACLRKLERLHCNFEGHSELMEFLRFWDETSPRNYVFLVGLFNGHTRYCLTGDKVVWLGNLSINKDGDFQPILPKDIKCLGIYRSLCDVPSLLIKYATKLESINIEGCDSMESLVSSSWLCSTPLPLPPMFSSVKKLVCYKCSIMKNLFPLVLLPNLGNLVYIAVDSCENVEEIIGVMGKESSNTKFELPKLRNLFLKSLPKLKSICSEKIICDSLGVIVVQNCQKLKRMPICFRCLKMDSHLLPLSWNNTNTSRRMVGVSSRVGAS